MSLGASFRSRTVLWAVLLFCFSSVARAQQPGPEYAGSEACQLCHEDIYRDFQKNRHWLVETDKRRGWETRACESCHGPGAKHSESTDASSIRQPAKQAPALADKTCLSCHVNQPTHVGRVNGGHARNQVACVSCHPVHNQPVQPAGWSRASLINRQCGACHASERASFQRPHGHRLNQGAMSCADCHNPHGAMLAKSLQTTAGSEPGCLRCHGDKRGPFAFEHAPVRVEGCQSCHEPHGSANPRMLTRHEVAQQCLECHANIGLPQGGTRTGALGGVPPAFHDLRSARFRNCTTCHIKIHGSHVNRALLR